MKIKTVKKRNTRRPGVNMKKKVASHFEDWSITESHVTPTYIILRTELNVINGQRITGRIYLFVYLFI